MTDSCQNLAGRVIVAGATTPDGWDQVDIVKPSLFEGLVQLQGYFHSRPVLLQFLAHRLGHRAEYNPILLQNLESPENRAAGTGSNPCDRLCPFADFWERDSTGKTDPLRSLKHKCFHVCFR